MPQIRRLRPRRISNNKDSSRNPIQALSLPTLSSTSRPSSTSPPYLDQRLHPRLLLPAYYSQTSIHPYPLSTCSPHLPASRISTFPHPKSTPCPRRPPIPHTGHSRMLPLLCRQRPVFSLRILCQTRPCQQSPRSTQMTNPSDFVDHLATLCGDSRSGRPLKAVSQSRRSPRTPLPPLQCPCLEDGTNCARLSLHCVWGCRKVTTLPISRTDVCAAVVCTRHCGPREVLTLGA